MMLRTSCLVVALALCCALPALGRPINSQDLAELAPSVRASTKEAYASFVARNQEARTTIRIAHKHASDEIKMRLARQQHVSASQRKLLAATTAATETTGVQTTMGAPATTTAAQGTTTAAPGTTTTAAGNTTKMMGTTTMVDPATKFGMCTVPKWIELFATGGACANYNMTTVLDSDAVGDNFLYSLSDCSNTCLRGLITTIANCAAEIDVSTQHGQMVKQSNGWALMLNETCASTTCRLPVQNFLRNMPLLDGDKCETMSIFDDETAMAFNQTSVEARCAACCGFDVISSLYGLGGTRDCMKVAKLMFTPHDFAGFQCGMASMTTMIPIMCSNNNPMCFTKPIMQTSADPMVLASKLSGCALSSPANWTACPAACKTSVESMLGEFTPSCCASQMTGFGSSAESIMKGIEQVCMRAHQQPAPGESPSPQQGQGDDSSMDDEDGPLGHAVGFAQGSYHAAQKCSVPVTGTPCTGGYNYMTEHPCKPVAKASATLTLSAAFPTTAAARQAVITALINAIASSTGLAKSAITVSKLVPGSIIATVEVTETAGSTVSASAAVAQIASDAASGTSGLVTAMAAAGFAVDTTATVATATVPVDTVPLTPPIALPGVVPTTTPGTTSPPIVASSAAQALPPIVVSAVLLLLTALLLA